MRNAILEWLGRRGWCVHPAEAIEVFHFSSKTPEGEYTNELICGHLCNICMARVRIPKCERHKERV